MNPVDSDCIVIGAGIAGASVAYHLAPHQRVVMLERESQPGYHSTGRSAAIFIESYGTPQVRALTRASRRFFEAPPAGFCDVKLVTPRGCLYVAGEGEELLLDELARDLGAESLTMQRLSRDAALAIVPVLRAERLIQAVLDVNSADIDVNNLHQGFLRGVRRAGGSMICDAEVTVIEKAGASWHVHAGGAIYRAPTLINAAGAWADVIGTLAGAAPIGLEPRRRSAFTFAAPSPIRSADWPMVIGAAEDWYMKPMGAMLMASPGNADPTHPQDVQADELDIAQAIDRIEAATTLTIGRPASVWAGLRSFVADGDLVGGYDDRLPGFFWVAAQGGYGIQTAPAMGAACAALVREAPLPDGVAEFGLTAAALSPSRLR